MCCIVAVDAASAGVFDDDDSYGVDNVLDGDGDIFCVIKGTYTNTRLMIVSVSQH